MKPLAELTLSDVEALLSNYEALRSSFGALYAVAMSGDALMMVKSADELKDIGIQVITARLLYSKLQGWKANGVERSSPASRDCTPARSTLLQSSRSRAGM